MFKVHSSFCSDCGSVLPSAGVTEFITCYICKKKIYSFEFNRKKLKYTIHFNNIENLNFAERTKKNVSADGPVAERNCKKCGHNLMSYAAMQLRSADEGQTIFYTCLKCKSTEFENS